MAERAAGKGLGVGSGAEAVEFKALSESDLASLKPVGEGVTAEVFKLGNDRVVKLFRPEHSRETVAYEAFLARIADSLGVAAPQYYGTVSASGRYGIVYGFVEGRSLLEELLAADSKGQDRLIEEMAGKHLELFRAESGELPRQSVRFADRIANAGLDDATVQALNRFLGSLEPRASVCHGDFHAGNILRGKEGLVILDWMNAYAGNPEGDVMRSLLMLESPYLPFPVSPLERLALAFVKARLAKRYLQAIERAMPVANKRAWRAVAAAVRLSDRLPGEERWLRKMIGKNLRYVR